MTADKDDEVLRTNRIYDRDIVSQFYPKMATFKSEEIGIYWRGPIPLIDGSNLEMVVIEDGSGTAPKYTVTLRNPPEVLARSTKAIAQEEFASCREALITTERKCNTELYENRPKNTRRRWWTF